MGDELKNDDADYAAYEEEMAKPLTAMEQLVLFVEHDLEAPCLYDLHHEVLQTTAELERLRSELKQAREIIGAFVQANDDEMPLGLCDQVDNTGAPYQSQHFADLVARARAFLKEHEDV